MSDTPRVDALDNNVYPAYEMDEYICGWVDDLEILAKTLECELAAMKAQRDRAIEVSLDMSKEIDLDFVMRSWIYEAVEELQAMKDKP